MRVLMISGDKNLLVEGSDAHARLQLQRAHVERLDVFVWPQVHSLRDIVRAARTHQYDVITAQDPFWRGLLAWRTARVAGARLNVQVHVDLAGQSFFRRLLARFVLRRADSVRAVSDKVKEQVSGAKHKGNIQVLPLYIDLTRFKNIEPVPHQRPAMLWIGRFEKEKDPLYAIEVLAAVRKTGIDAVLVMLGAGKLESALRKAAKKLPVEFPGWKPPEEYLKFADVVLCTSPYESWGASIIEALAAGVPVVAPDVGIAREAGAIVVPRHDMAAAIARAIREKPCGELQLSFMDKEAWATRWKETLA